MGHFCFCIPLGIYAIFIGCFHFIYCLANFIKLCMFPVPEEDKLFAWIWILYNGVLGISAILLIIGSFTEREEYIAPYLIVMAITIGILIIGIVVAAFMSTALAIYFALQVVGWGLICFPIYLLYVETSDEITETGFTV